MNHSKSKRKKYFSSNLMVKKNRDLFVKTGLKGFLCTCNGNERQCIREAYNILNEYADKLYGEEKLDKPQDPVVNVNSTSVDEDVMDEFQKEVEAMKTQSAQGTRRFRALDTSILNCIFIETTLDDPVSLLHNIMADLFETKQKKVRFLLRMVPVEVTCRAFMDDLEKTANTLFDKYFKKEPTSYGIVYNKRHNSSLDRDTVIRKLAAIVEEKNKEHKVNLTNPNLTIVVEAMKNICCLSVLQDYFRFSKFNLHSICGIEKMEAVNAVVAKKVEDSSTDNKSTDETEGAVGTIDIKDHIDEIKATDVDNDPRGDCVTAAKVESPSDSITVADVH